MAQRRKKQIRQRAPTWAEIRREVEAWPHVRLVEFAMKRIDADRELRARVERGIVAGSGKAAAAKKFQSEIDRVLDIGFVEWRQVRAFIGRLDDLLEDITAFGEDSPAVALDVVWHFVGQVPSVFNSVHDEVELADFCRDLARSAVALTKSAAASVRDLAARLLDAYLADDTYRFDGVRDVLVEARFPKGERDQIAAAAEERAAQAGAHQASELSALAARLRRRTTRKAKGKKRSKGSKKGSQTGA